MHDKPRKVPTMAKRYLIMVLILVAMLVGCNRAPATAATPVATTPPVDAHPRSHSGGVAASGLIAPARWTSLGAQTGGVVVEVQVEPGHRVAAGQTLACLDTAELKAALAKARQGVVLQQAILDQLLAGASKQTIARAERDHTHQVAQAKLALRASEQELEQARARDPEQDVAAAQARVRQLELQLLQAHAQDPEPEVTMAQVALERAKIALDETQDEYNKALDRPWEDQSIRDTWAKRLRQVELNYRLAQAQLDRAQNAQRAHTVGLAALEAQLEEAGIALAQTLEAREAYSVTLSALGTGVQAARTRLDYLRSWENPYLDRPSEDEIAQAQARLEQARLGLAQIEHQIDAACVRAPFAGTVSEVHAHVGQVALPGQTLLSIGDLGTLCVETTDLSERDVARVAAGQEATVYVEALGAQIPGRVANIAPEATTVGGDVVYKVTVDLDEHPPGLRWGMSVEVEIEAR
jgi:multidrug efflux pump subunit AcrA (membrane-fusion protein)